MDRDRLRALVTAGLHPPPVGFRSIRLSFDLDTDAGAADLAELLETTERACVVLQTLVAPTAVALTAG